jgi:hypothetical protein
MIQSTHHRSYQGPRCFVGMGAGMATFLFLVTSVSHLGALRVADPCMDLSVTSPHPPPARACHYGWGGATHAAG